MKGASQDDAKLGALFRPLLDALPVGLYVVDRRYCVVAWNRMREAEPNALPASKAVGAQLEHVLPPEAYRGARRAIGRIFRSGAVTEESLDMPGARYRVRRLPVVVGGRVTHVVSCFENVTKRQDLELRLVAADRWAFLGQIVAGVAHEISNPLAGIAGCAEALAQMASVGSSRARAREARHFRDLVRSEVARCEGLVRFLLESSRPEEGTTADVRATVRSSLRLLDRHPSFTRVRVRTRLPEAAPAAKIPPETLKHALVAILARGASTMPAGGTLGVSLRHEKTHLLVDITDSGPPVDRNGAERLFDPWDGSLGAGLGLAVARSLLRRHGGELEAHPRRRGARLRLTLPALGRSS